MKKAGWIFVVFLSVLLVRVLVPLHQLKDPRLQEWIFQDHRSILTGYDSYIYARYASEIQKGEYKKADNLKGAPEGSYVRRPSLLSYLGAWLASIGKINIEEVAFYLPPILSSLAVIFLLLWGWEIKNGFTGFTSVIFSLLTPVYGVRTNFGRFDTDSLNLFFPFSIAYFLYLSIESTSLLLPSLAGIFFFLFDWWWNAAVVFLVPIALIYAFLLFLNDRSWNSLTKISLFLLFSRINILNLAMALILIFVVKKTSGNRFSKSFFKFSLISSLVAGVAGSKFYPSIISALAHIIGYGFRTPVEISGAIFPSVMISVKEAAKMNFPEFLKFASGSQVISIIGILGFLLLFIKKWRKLLLLFPFIALGFSSIITGVRYLMFASPFIGLGFGAAISYGIEYLPESKARLKRFLLIAAYIFVIFMPAYNRVFLFLRPKPILSPPQYRVLSELKKNSSKDSCLWTWWDKGYAAQFLSGIPTVIDGGFHPGDRVYLVASSFSSDKPGFLNNFSKMLCNGKEIRLLSSLRRGKFKPRKEMKSSKEIFLVFTSDMLTKFGWIYYFGTWDLKKGGGKRIPPLWLKACNYGSEKEVIICDKVVVDLKRKHVFETVHGKEISLRRLVLVNVEKRVRNEIDFPENKSDVTLELFISGSNIYGIMMDEKVYRTNFNRLYLLLDFDPSSYQLLYCDFPEIVVYKIL